MDPDHRRGDWIQTYTGIQFWPLDPRPEELEIKDIAHSLSLLCRFNGHCKRYYSVAEHSIHVANFLPADLQLAGLLHDASEAYIADLPMPVKRNLPDYNAIEEILHKVITERYSLPWPLPKEVKRVDSLLLATEKNALMGPEPAPWHSMPDPVDATLIQGWQPEQAERRFLQMFQRLV